MRVWLLVAALTLGLMACTTGEKIRGADGGGGLQEGMTPQQVVAVVGRPDGVVREGDYLGYKWANVLISGWNWDRTDYSAIFYKDRLTAWGPGEIRQSHTATATILILSP